MGHAFGLNHMCVENAKRSTATNIMASGGKYETADGKEEDCEWSGGERNLGFDAGQSQTVLRTAELIYETLGIFRPLSRKERSRPRLN